MSKLFFRNTFLLLASVTIISLVAGCKEDPASPPPSGPGEEEQITTVRLILKSDTTGGFPADSVAITWRDIDVNGPIQFTITPDSLRLGAGRVYRGSFVILDETKTPAKDIAEEIVREANEHQVFFVPSAGFLTITRNDSDTNVPRLALGLDYTVRVDAMASAVGLIQIFLCHYDDGVTKIANPIDDRDFDIILPVRVR
jgi:hypothetical protein